MALPVDATTFNHQDAVESQLIRIPTLIGTVFVDAAVSEAPSETMTATSHPVEDGSEVSDFIIEDQQALVLDCIFVDDDYGWLGDDKVSRELKQGERLTTAVDKQEAIRALMTAKQPFIVSTEDRIYPDMVLVDIGQTKTVRTSGSFVALLTFVNIKMIEFETLELDLSLIADQNVAKKKSKKKDLGKTDGTDLDAADQAQYESVLNGLLN